MDTKNILFICGGAFDGIEKIIEGRVNKKTMGFGAEIKSKKEREEDEILKKLQPHDLLKFGIIPELVGRLPVITSLDPLTKEHLVRILTEPKNALVKQYEKLMDYDNVMLTFEPRALELVAEKALERGIGARGLRAILEEIMLQVMFDVPSQRDIYEVIVTADCVENGSAPKVHRNPERLTKVRDEK